MGLGIFKLFHRNSPDKQAEAQPTDVPVNNSAAAPQAPPAPEVPQTPPAEAESPVIDPMDEKIPANPGQALHDPGPGIEVELPVDSSSK